MIIKSDRDIVSLRPGQDTVSFILEPPPRPKKPQLKPGLYLHFLCLCESFNSIQRNEDNTVIFTCIRFEY